MSSYLIARSLDGLARFGLAFAGPGRLVRAALQGRSALAEEQARRRRTSEVRARLARLLDWPEQQLPATGGWAGMPDFLLLLAETVRERKPKVVVEFGSGASTVVIARAMQLEGGGRFVSYDHHAGFAEATRRRVAALGLSAEVRAVELVPAEGYGGRWYAGEGMPERIDLAVIDGPPAWLEAGTRGGAAPAIFPRIAAGGLVLLDDAKRAGERENVRQWQAQFPEFSYREIETDKGIVAIERN
jgi:predicted O-methyltransferase YrrM